MFECVLNISEGQNVALLDELVHDAGSSFRDRHSDPWHHRSVFTLINSPDKLEDDVRSLIQSAFTHLTLDAHQGVHPRFGVVDVVPFVALEPHQRAVARELRDRTAQWIANTFQVPTFLYGEIDDRVLRTLPDIRRQAFVALEPDFGPPEPSAHWGSCAVGEREILIAWNIWLEATSFERATEMARVVRSKNLRALAFRVGDDVQVSCNLIAWEKTRPSEVYDQVKALLSHDERIVRCELVGLAPASLLEAEDPKRLVELGLTPNATIEAALAHSAGL